MALIALLPECIHIILMNSVVKNMVVFGCWLLVLLASKICTYGYNVIINITCADPCV